MIDPHDMLSWASFCFVTVLITFKFFFFFCFLVFSFYIFFVSETCKSFDRDPASISCFPRRLEDVFSIKSFHRPRRLQDVFPRCLPNMSSIRLQNIFKTSLKDVSQDVFKTCLQVVFFKTSSKRLQEDILQTRLKTSLRRLEDVLVDKKLLH